MSRSQGPTVDLWRGSRAGPKRRPTVLLVLAVLGLSISFEVGGPATAQDPSFTFAVTVDQRNFAGPGAYDTSLYFRGAVEAIASLGGGAFMISPGDVDPPAGVVWTIEQTLGPDYTWLPGVGNHEAETPADMDWLRAYDYGPVNPGPPGCPETTYSFDYQNAHFVMLNEYCDAAGDAVTDGDVPDQLYDWLAADLAATDRPLIFVLGHEPAFPQPDADNGRLRHLGDSLDQYPAHRDRFWSLLRDEGVLAYICGHTHNYSLVQEDGVWQLDAGHARGAGDTGAASTFVLIHVAGDAVTYNTYRDSHDGVYDYDDLMHSGLLTPSAGPAHVRLYLPLVLRQPR